MSAHPSVWLLRVAWLALPFTLGEQIADAVAGRSTAVAVTVAVLAWAAWGAGIIAAVVPHPVTLTALRIVTPAAAVAGIVAMAGATGDASVLGIVGVALAIVAAAAALSAPLADEYVDAASYGDERRFALRTPVAFLMGPAPLAWAVVAVVPAVGVLLLAAQRWILGAIVTVVGVAAAVVAVRSLHALARRWLVFVPAGMTVVDPFALVEPVLLARRTVVSFAPAVEGTGATDLTRGAPGLVLEAALEPGVELVVRTSRDVGDVTVARGVLLCPGRPGAVLAEAGRRHLAAPDRHTASPPPTTSSPS